MAGKQERVNNEKRQRAALRKADASRYVAPEGEEQEWPADLGCGCRIVSRAVYAEYLLVQFAVIWVHRIDIDEWEEMYSVDTAHGSYHEHVTGHKKKPDARELRPLYTQVDVQECFDAAYDRVLDRHDRSCEVSK